MITQAYFENIQDEILKEINKAQHSIFVAVAWLTDRVIFSALCEKAKANIDVELLLINDTINNDYASFDHKILKEHGGKVFFVNPSKEGAIMHHKFCVIDRNTVITGSYNWSKKAQQNDENVVITSEAQELGTRFIQEFNSIKDRIAGEKFTIGQVDIAKAIKRLEIIKGLILLEEDEEITSHVRKLKEVNVTSEIIEIIKRLESKEFGLAISLIEDFKFQQSQLTVYDDPEIFALQLELKSVEIQLNAIENEKVEVEKALHEFSIQYNTILGKTILEILNLKKQLAQSEKEKEQAEAEEEEFSKDYDNKKDIKIKNLNEADQKELKKLYREASMQCHPDKFIDDPIKVAIAQKVFVALTEAYKSNDLDKVREILHNLKSGNFSIDEVVYSNKKEDLKSQISNLKRKLKETAAILNDLKISSSYNIIERNKNLEQYFSELKQKLEFELELLKKEFESKVNYGK